MPSFISRAITFLLLAAPLGAFAAGSVDVKLIAELRIEEGPANAPQYRYVPATSVREGEEIFYTLQVRNTGAEPATEVEVIRPLPGNTVYMPNSASGAGAEISLSTDGGQTFSAERARPNDRSPPPVYTHIRWRWRYPLAPGAVALARFRAVFK